MKGAAKFSDDRVYRYILGRVWDEETIGLTWVMLNPSTATSKKDDPTIRRVIGYSRAWGYGSCWVVNLFAFRSTDPKDLLANYKLGRDIVGPLNDKWIDTAVRMGTEPVLAWGRNARLFPDRVKEVITNLERIRRPLRCIGYTTGGHPVHPLMQPRDAKLLIYEGKP